MSELKTYNPQERHVGSSGFTNYMGATEEQYAAARAQVFADFPGSVIVDGSEDWTVPPEWRPSTFLAPRRPNHQGYDRDPAPVTVLALYHSGISGIVRSGIVVSAEDYAKLAAWYEASYGKKLDVRMRVYHAPLSCPKCGQAYLREPDRSGLRLCKCGETVPANPGAP